MGGMWLVNNVMMCMGMLVAAAAFTAAAPLPRCPRPLPPPRASPPLAPQARAWAPPCSPISWWSRCARASCLSEPRVSLPSLSFLRVLLAFHSRPAPGLSLWSACLRWGPPVEHHGLVLVRMGRPRPLLAARPAHASWSAAQWNPPCRRYDLENAPQRDEGASMPFYDAWCRLWVPRSSARRALQHAAPRPCRRPALQRAAPRPARPARADKIKALAKRFGKWHGISSLINLGTLVAAVGHGYWLAGERRMGWWCRSCRMPRMCEWVGGGLRRLAAPRLTCRPSPPAFPSAGRLLAGGLLA